MEKDFRKYLEASQAYLGTVEGFREAMIQAMEKKEREKFALVLQITGDMLKMISPIRVYLH